jgi:hypothetical protein
LVRPRRVFLVTSVVALTACGISAVGELLDGSGPTRDAGEGDGPALLPDGAPAGDGGSDGPLDDGNPNNACLAACEAGSCDAGTCVLECTDAAAPCVAGAVVCPPGVPCAVRCAVNDSCQMGVDCRQASACDIACSGGGSCFGGVMCAGSTCNVQCTGAGATCTAGVQCDAGTCNIACAKDDCTGGLVTCAGEECNVLCGVDAATAEKNGCKKGVECYAAKQCFIDCISDDTCNGTVKVATDGGARVHCLAVDSCKGSMSVTAADASIICGANEACEGTIGCDAGACTFLCTAANGKAIDVCCEPPSCSADSGPCTNITYTCK